MSNLTYILIYLGIGALLNLLFIILNKYHFRWITQRTIEENKDDLAIFVFILASLQFCWIGILILFIIAALSMGLTLSCQNQVQRFIPR